LIDSVFHIGIIGVGPKGFFGFERLLANLKSNPGVKIHIHLFNLNKLFATGWIYDPQQPDYLKMNYPNIHISLESISKPSSIIKIISFSEWQANRFNKEIEQEDYQIASRAEVGVYFNHYFHRLIEAAPEHITIHTHKNRVESIDKVDRHYLIHTNDEKLKSPYFSSLLITTGHSTSISSKMIKTPVTKNYVPFIYPIQEQLGSLPSNTIIACKGMGLTAIDAVLGLTEGRGGEFKLNAKKECSYIKSGEEPLKIYPFSLSGIPIIPRNPNPRGSQKSFFFKRFIEDDTSKTKIFDFEKELLPLIKQDILGEYYFQLFKNCDIFLNLNQQFDRVEEEIKEFHLLYVSEKKFKAADLFYPYFNDKELNLELPRYWKMWLTELESTNSPLIAAAGAWKNISTDFNKVYSENRLVPSSKAKFKKKYFSLFNRVSYGPPVINIKKMLVIAELGILDFSYAKNPIINTKGKNNTLKLNQNSTSFDILIDARIPRGYDKNSKLIFNKVNSTIFTYDNSMIYHNYADRLKCNKDGNPLDGDGNPDFNICLYGTPTEGFLFDNDTLSRKKNDTASLWAQRVDELIK